MASSNPYRFAGYRYDDSTGLYYLMARYYDANVGRFITRDTFQRFEDDALSLNQYTYCNNNSANMVDPSGHFVQAVVIYIAKALVAGTVAYGTYLVGRYWKLGYKGILAQWVWKDWAFSVAQTAVFSLPIPILTYAARVLMPTPAKIVKGITWSAAVAAATWIAHKIYK